MAVTPKIKWLSRKIALEGPYLTLCLTEAQLAKALKDIKQPPLEPGDYPQSGARAHIYESTDKSSLTCIVCVSADMQALAKDDPTSLVCGLVHEAVHVAQYHFKHIGEDAPGTEAMAYAVQFVSATLISRYSEMTAGDATPAPTQAPNDGPAN